MINGLLSIIFNKIKYNSGWMTNEEFDDFIFNFIKNKGVVFIKFSQIISSKVGGKKIFGNNLFNKLCTLQDRCYQNNFNILPYINYIQEEPFASGSICQIFKIMYNNKISILKVLVPDIESSINDSFQNMKALKQILYYTNTYYYNIINLIDLNELYDTIIEHLQLDNEADNTKKFYDIFKNTEKIIIPEIFYNDKEKIIMSLEEGIKITDIKNKKHKDEALYLICSFFYICIKNNILHGDFHNSNFYFKIINDEVKMIVLDFGITCYIEDKYKDMILSVYDTGLTDDERNLLYKKIFNEFDIYLQDDNDIENQKITLENLFDNVDIQKVPLKYISLALVLPYYKTLIIRKNMNSFLIKLFNYMYKNKFLII
jgi:predicted unusual protein kinase regulating ubiquinone biosynthesis (AarF/ABC1/UbiB family)